MLGSVLIVGEEHKDGKLLKEALKKEASTFTVHQIAFSAQVLSVISEKRPTILLLNPATNSHQAMDVYYALKKEPGLSDITVGFLIDEPQMRMADLPSGVAEVLFRPLKISEAVARIHFLFKRVHKIDEKNLIIRGKLAMDVSRYEVRIDERKIDLTFTEFELLKFLCTNPGIVFTREVLLNKVWGYEYYGGTRTVDVHIRRLRSKIESKSCQFIDTVRNIGYKFIAED